MTARTAVLITFLLATSLGAQDRTVRGVVLDASTGAPIVHASVMAMVGTNAAGTVVESDERGGFVLTAPTPAPSLRIAKAGYALTTVAVPTGDPVLEIRLARSAAITGRLVNEAGVPLVGMFISAYPVARDGTVEASSPHMAMVDDRGEFRVGSLPEGRYVVGSTSESAQVPPVLLRPGDEIDVPLDPVRTTCGAGASPSPSATARASVVRGRVLAPNGVPLPCAGVELVPVGAPAAASQFRTVTDARGRFEFHAVPAAAFTVEALNSRLGAARVGPIDVAPADANHVDDIELRMIPDGVITGTVVDDRGEPLVGVMVTASELRQRDGHVFLLGPVPVAGLPALTDDRGRFRIFGLRTGRYVVSSIDSVRTSLTFIMPRSEQFPVYYPGVRDVSLAVPVSVGAGQVRDGIDIQRTQFEGVSVSGSVVDSAGVPAAGGEVSLQWSARVGALLNWQPSRLVNSRFEFRNVPPGDYVVQVGNRIPGRSWEFGRALVTVGDTALSPLSIRLTPGHVVTGRLVFEGGDPRSLPHVMIAPVDLDDTPTGVGAAELQPSPTGEFRATQVVGLRRFTLGDSPPGWYVKSVRIGGRETGGAAFDFGFGSEPITDVELVVSAAAASVTGTVRDRDAARLGYTAVVFSTDPDDWRASSRRVRLVRSTPDGRFSVTSLSPGSYFVAAVPALDDFDFYFWEDQISLNQLIGDAERVTLNEGETRDVTLRLQQR